MKKRNAIIYGTSFLLMVVAYVAWCWRPFYLLATITYDDAVPPAARRAVEQWAKEEPYYSKPSPFTLTHSIYRLSKSWLDMRKARVSPLGESVMTEELLPQPGKSGDLYLQFNFKEIDGRWQLKEWWQH